MFAGFGSADILLTCTVLVRVPGFFGVTIMVTVTLAPLLKSPRLQATVLLDCVQLPAVDVAETNCTFAGSVSVNCTSAAAPGLLFVISTLYVSGWPLVTGSGESVFITKRSAAGRLSCTKMLSKATIYRPSRPGLDVIRKVS